MAVEVPQNKEISERVKNGSKKVGSAIRRKRANMGNINIKERERGGVVK